MTPESQRIAIAEACGWSYEKNETYAPDGAFWWSKNPEFPDYLNDLNAMHDAWLKLSPSEKERFESHLYSIVIGEAEYNHNDDAGWITNATAAQRAEALLKTLNLWKP
jgi:hypothetical protein